TCTIVSVLLSYPLAYFLARARRTVRALCLFLLLMPLMVSSVIRTYGWLVILGREGLVNSVLHALGLTRVSLLYNEPAIVVGLANIFIPFMTLPLMVSIERIDPRLEEAARNLGATWPAVFRRVIIPLSAPGLISGCLLVYTAALSAFVVPVLMGGPRIQMLAQRIYDQMVVSYQWPHASATTTVLVMGTGLLIIIALSVARHRPKEEQTV
ncbi:MAG: ABC transporter permease, partial [Acetobacteraceae bacterium]